MDQGGILQAVGEGIEQDLTCNGMLGHRIDNWPGVGRGPKDYLGSGRPCSKNE